jgi:hypothetical protein
MKISVFILTLLAVAAMSGGLSSCSNDSIEDLYPGIYAPDTTPCDTSNMTYDATMKPLFITKCGADQTDCHKSPNTAQKNLDNYADAADLGINGDIMGAVNHEAGFTPMPNNGTTLDNCSKAMIQAWVNRACPEN